MRGSGCIKRAFFTKNFPDRRVFASEPPQGHAQRLHGTNGHKLVKRCDGVKKPDVMDALIVIEVIEGRVERAGIQCQFTLRFFGGEHRFFKSTFFGWLARRAPVVGVVADGDDQLVGRNVILTFAQCLDKPGQTGDRTGLSVSPVFVVGHQDQVVDVRHHTAVCKTGVGGRHVRRNREFSWMHHRVQLGNEKLIVWLCPGLDVFKVDADASVLMPLNIGQYLVNGVLACHRVAEHSRQLGTFPGVAVPVVDQWYQRDVGSAVADVFGGVSSANRIVFANCAVVSGQMQPLANHSIQAAQVLLE